MWNLEPTTEYLRRHRRYEKKHPKELAAVLSNVDWYFEALVNGSKPQQIKAGFIHHEPRGVLAIDQKGGGPYLQETRLYVFPQMATETLYTITIGNKAGQRDDIAFCTDFVSSLN